MRIDGRTDMTKPIVTFRSFGNAPKMCHCLLHIGVDLVSEFTALLIGSVSGIHRARARAHAHSLSLSLPLPLSPSLPLSLSLPLRLKSDRTKADQTRTATDITTSARVSV